VPSACTLAVAGKQPLPLAHQQLPNAGTGTGEGGGVFHQLTDFYFMNPFTWQSATNRTRMKECPLIKELSGEGQHSRRSCGGSRAPLDQVLLPRLEAGAQRANVRDKHQHLILALSPALQGPNGEGL